MADDRAGAGSTAQRIAELERALDAAARENERLRALSEAAPVGLYQTDAEGLCLHINKHLSDLVGINASDALGRTWRKVVHPDDQTFVSEEWIRSHRDGVPFDLEYRFRRENGSIAWLLTRCSPLRSPDGKVTGYVGMVMDVTERRRIDDVLQAQTALEKKVQDKVAALSMVNKELRLLEAVVENASDALAVVDGEGSILHVNPAFLALFSRTEDPIGQSLFNVIGLDEETSEAMLSAMDRDARYHGTSMVLGPDGPFPADLDSFSIRGSSGEKVGGALVLRDLTAMRRAEDERAALQAQVIASQEAAIREMSTPLLPLADHVIAMPLVGSIGNARAQQILETLLEGIGQHQAEVAILDVTGVRTVDEQVADALIRAEGAARLLGADVVLTGISPDMARIFVELGIDVRGMKTLSTLQSAIEYALSRRARPGKPAKATQRR